MSRSVSMKSRVTSLSTSTPRKGPKGLGAGRPRISAMKVAETSLSRDATIVWFSWTGTAGLLSRRGRRGALVDGQPGQQLALLLLVFLEADLARFEALVHELHHPQELLGGQGRQLLPRLRRGQLVGVRVGGALFAA